MSYPCITDRKSEIIKLTEQLIGAITSGNYDEYWCVPILLLHTTLQGPLHTTPYTPPYAPLYAPLFTRPHTLPYMAPYTPPYTAL